MTWTHYPNSPYGNIDICEHGCVRDHGSKEKECIICDYPKNVKLEMLPCAECKKLKNAIINTWHINGRCIPCSRRKKIKLKVMLI